MAASPSATPNAVLLVAEATPPMSMSAHATSSMITASSRGEVLCRLNTCIELPDSRRSQ